MKRDDAPSGKSVLKLEAEALRALAEQLDAIADGGLTIQPSMVSQRNALQTLGMPARAFLELLRSPEFTVPITRLGKLRLVDRDAMVAWLKSKATTRAPEPPEPEEPLSEFDRSIERAVIAAGGRVVREPRRG